MATGSVYDYDRVAGSNTDLGGNNVTGTGLVSTADNSFRAVMAHLRDFANDLGAVNTVGGTGNAITVTLSGAPAALTDGMRFVFSATAANSGDTAIVVTPNGGSAFTSKKIRRYSGGTDIALTGGEIPAAGTPVELIYDTGANSAAGAWILLNAVADVTLTGTQTLTNKTLTTPTLTLKQSAAPTPTAEGDIQWDTDDNRIVVGDGASQQIFPPDVTGTWTPAFAATGSTFSHSSQVGTYTRRGDRVMCEFRIVLNTSGNTLTANQLTVTGLPFANGNSVATSFALGWAATGSSFVSVSGALSSGASAISINGITAAGTSNASGMQASQLSATAGSAIFGQFIYKV